MMRGDLSWERMRERERLEGTESNKNGKIVNNNTRNLYRPSYLERRRDEWVRVTTYLHCKRYLTT